MEPATLGFPSETHNLYHCRWKLLLGHLMKRTSAPMFQEQKIHFERFNQKVCSRGESRQVESFMFRCRKQAQWSETSYKLAPVASITNKNSSIDKTAVAVKFWTHAERVLRDRVGTSPVSDSKYRIFFTIQRPTLAIMPHSLLP